MRRGDKKTIALVMGTLLIVLVGLIAASQGLGQPSVSKTDVARVDGGGPGGDDVFIPIGPETGPGLDLGTPFGEKAPPGTTSEAECDQAKIAKGICPGDFNRALAQAALRNELKELPKAGTPEYEALRDQAMGELLDAVWIEGEARDRGASVSQREVDQQLEQIKQQNFPTKKEYERFLRRSGFTPFDVEVRVRLQLLAEKIQQQVAKSVKPVTQAEVTEFYEANKKQFEQPTTRNARVIINADKAKIDQAKTALEGDTSPKNFKKVAKEFSTDPLSKDQGGLRENLVEGSTGDAALDEAVFSAPLNQLVGPVETAEGFALVFVTKETPGMTQELKAIQQQLQEQLSSQRQQEVLAAFIEDYRAKWTSKTICATGYIFERCDNAPALVQRAPGAPPVSSTRPAAPGQGAGLGQPLAAGLPQGPHPPGEDGAQQPAGGGLPPGAVPGGPGGAPPGAPPPGAGP